MSRWQFLEATVVRRIDFFGAFWQPIVGFFTTNGWKLALALLLFVGLFSSRSA